MNLIPFVTYNTANNSYTYTLFDLDVNKYTVSNNISILNFIFCVIKFQKLIGKI